MFVTRSKYKAILKLNDIPKEAGVILAANHQSQLDPFVLGSTMPFNVNWRFMPVRFMAYRELFGNLFLRGFLRSFGAFPTKEIRNLPYGLPYSIETLKNGGTVCIFPEGKRTAPGQTEPKRGVSELAKIENTVLIPIRLEWRKSWILKKVYVCVGKPIDARILTPEQIMRHIYELQLPS